MAKYSFEFKRIVVMEYITGKGGYEYLAKKHGIQSSTSIEDWVSRYNNYGEDGLRRSRQQQVYTFEFKLSVVELYLSSELSYTELAARVGITDRGRIVQWVNAYRAAGPDALRPKKKGRKRTMDEKEIIHKIEEGDSIEQKELLKQLQEENLKLRIENAFLKEARRLRLEEETLLNELRESSTASEENSN
jgi:transposase